MKSQAFIRARPRLGERAHVAIVLVALVAPIVVAAVAGAPLSGRHWVNLLAAAAGAVAFVIANRLVDPGRLIIDDRGIRFTSGGRQVFASFFSRSFSADWNQVAKITADRSFGIIQVRRKDTRIPLRIHAVQWVAEGGREPPPKRLALRRPPVEGTAVYKALQAHGAFDPARYGAGTSAADFDMAKHPATRIVLVAMALLFAASVADYVLTPEHWVEASVPYLTPPLVIAAFGCAGALMYLHAARKPRPIPLGVILALASLFAVTAGLASWTGLVHVNQLLGGELEPHHYVRNDRCDALVSVEPGLPTIEFGEIGRQYWCRFPKVQWHDVLVRRGLGGLFTVDVSEYNREIRRFNGHHW
ncbi:MAG TPA: hypothetical protein VFE23_03125 [Usitatibacter sp.]|jgi:hypothetical protein|nr:hypothetical protein [Usitatibacter sp.]